MDLVPTGSLRGVYEFQYRPAPAPSHGSLCEAGSGAFDF